MSNALTKFYLPAFFAAGLATAGSAMAGSTIELGYVVEVAGATMMKASFSTELDSGSFESSLSGKTAGMSDMFSGYKMNCRQQAFLKAAISAPSPMKTPARKRARKQSPRQSIGSLMAQSRCPTARPFPRILLRR
jgi:hypothetical protein